MVPTMTANKEIGKGVTKHKLFYDTQYTDKFRKSVTI